MTRKEAEEKLEQRIAFIEEVHFDELVIIVDGERYYVPVQWKYETPGG